MGRSGGLVCLLDKEAIVTEVHRLGEFSIILWCGLWRVGGKQCGWLRMCGCLQMCMVQENTQEKWPSETVGKY